MIPEEPEVPKSILESFAEKIERKDFTSQKRTVVYEMVDKILRRDLESMESWDEWHKYLADQGMLLVKHDRGNFNEARWYKWSQKKRFVVRSNPASKQHAYEWILVPQEIIEKMIVLGRLDEFLD